MIVWQDLIEKPLYKDLNVTIHHQWISLFTLHMDLESQILNFIDASFVILTSIVKNYIICQ